MSRRIVITSWGSYGDVYPYVGLALALAKRGHRPVLAAPEFYRDAVEREGLREYYDPRDGRGLGAVDFAWSALIAELAEPDPAAARSHL